MATIMVLDTGPAGRLTHPAANLELVEWLRSKLAAGVEVVLPEIVDYELRRNFLLEISRGNRGFRRSLERLEALQETLTFLPLNSEMMRKAAEFWAGARRRGKPTADLKELDADAILAAQTWFVGGTVITENVGHLSLFVNAQTWRDMS